MDLKQTFSDDELKVLRSQLGISEQEAQDVNCTPTSPIEEGDVFAITGVSKVRETVEHGFLPLVFTTSNGKLIGTKHFGNIEFPKGTKGVQPIGRTVDDALRYLLWSKKNNLTFTVDSIQKLPSREITDNNGNKTTYRPKRFDLSVLLPKEPKEPEESKKKSK